MSSRKPLFYFSTLALAIFSFLAGQARAAGTYTITDLGPVTDSVRDINLSGQAVGVTGSHNYLYNGTLPLVNLGSNGSGIRISINNAGLIVGTNGSNHAFLKNGGVVTDLSTLGGSSSFGTAINNNNLIVGSSFTSGGQEHAFMYSGAGPMQDLGSPLGNSVAQGVNDSGQIVGYMSASPGSLVRSGFVYSTGTGMLATPTLGGTFTAANDINNLGQITGSSANAGGQWRPFIINSGIIQDLGSLGGTQGWGNGLNDNGEVVGASAIVGGTLHGFWYQNSGSIIDLNTLIAPGSGWVINEAFQINNNGQIVALGTFGGVSHGMILTPTPEPMTLSIVGLAAGLLLLRRNARRSFGRCR